MLPTGFETAIPATNRLPGCARLLAYSKNVTILVLVLLFNEEYRRCLPSILSVLLYSANIFGYVAAKTAVSARQDV